VASALAAIRVTRTIVSTDSEAIAEAAYAYGTEAPFRRPASIAADDTPDLPLFEHALDSLPESDRQADCVRTVTVPKQTPYNMWRPEADGYMEQLGRAHLF
jgi:CMP-N-acetylneuraminic acid synthetase